MTAAQTIAPPTHTAISLDPLDVLHAVGVSAGMRVADFGCGHGHFVFPAAKLVGERGSVFAIDLQSDLVHAIASRAQTEGLMQVKPIWADLEQRGSTHLPDGVVDMVLIINNHINAEAQQKMLREAVRILKSGGECVVIDWLTSNAVPFAPAIVERVEKNAAIINAHTAGLQVVDEFRPSRYHYGLRFKKI